MRMEVMNRSVPNFKFDQFRILAACLIVTIGLLICGCGVKVADNKWSTIGATPTPTDLKKKETDGVRSGNFNSSLPEGFEQPTDSVGRKMLREYGAVYIARGGAVPPTKVVFKDEADVAAYQAKAGAVRETVGGVSIELQAAAMKALQEAASEAGQKGMTITPRGSDAAKRDYQGTVDLWKSRVDPGLDHWSQQGRITAADADRIRRLSPFEQVPEIFKLEEKGIYFAKDLSKSIIYSVAPPGTSQHLSMLALDVTENENVKIRETLARHGWFQTVPTDLPHFTFLGVPESELTKLGLKQVRTGGRIFYVPNL